MATRFLKISWNDNKILKTSSNTSNILKSKLMTAPSWMIIFNFLFPFSIEHIIENILDDGNDGNTTNTAAAGNTSDMAQVNNSGECSEQIKEKIYQSLKDDVSYCWFDIIEANQITLKIMGYHFSSRLTATLNICPIYFKITWALAILLEHMH